MDIRLSAFTVLIFSLLLTSPSFAGKGDAFNPSLSSSLPNSRQVKGEGIGILKAMGASTQSIANEGSYRPYIRDEIYPVLFGDSKAPHEILAVLDFGKPQSETVWAALVSAIKELSPQKVKLVLFSEGREELGKDLMGLAIWTKTNRSGQEAIKYMSWVLKRWNEVKRTLRAKGQSRPFMREYDAVASEQDYPLPYIAMTTCIRPSVPDSEHPVVGNYIYEAGNLNSFQAHEVQIYYNVKSLPAVIVDGQLLATPSREAILAALR